jgi:hypothetical protein
MYLSENSCCPFLCATVGWAGLIKGLWAANTKRVTTKFKAEPTVGFGGVGDIDGLFIVLMSLGYNSIVFLVSYGILVVSFFLA